MKEVEEVMGVTFVSDKVRGILEGIDKRKKKQSKRKKSLKFKGRAKELGELRIGINIAQREVTHLLPCIFLIPRQARSSKYRTTTSLSRKRNSNLSSDPLAESGLKKT